MAKFCPECGNPLISETSKFCDKCGEKLPYESPSIQSPESQPAHSRYDVPPASSDTSTVQTQAPQPQSPTIETTTKKRSAVEWFIIIGGGIILLIILSSFVAGMFSGSTRDNYQYCSANYPGTVYDPVSKLCEHTQTPYPTSTPAQQTNTISENDRLFASTAAPYLVTLQLEAKQISNAATSYDMDSLSYWSSKMSSTCSEAMDELSGIRVSPEFQPAKNELLSALSDYKKAGDSAVTGVNYFDKGQTSLSTSYLEAAVTYTNNGNAKIKTANRLTRDYLDKYG